MVAKTKKSAKKSAVKKPVAKKPVAKKPVAKKPAPSGKVRAVATPAVAPATLDGDDTRAPDAPVTTLAKHAEALAGTVRTLAAALSKSKVTVGDADRLDALAAQLRKAEDVWIAARRAMATGTVAQTRQVLTVGRNDLYGALDAFVDDDAVVRELEDIGGIDDDDDLDRDTKRLLDLCEAHADDLEGTEITEERTTEIAEALEAFRRARRGAPVDEGGDTKQALSEAARAALEARNRLFWQLADLDRRVCRRGRFGFRADARRRAEFSAYATEGRRTRRVTTKKNEPPVTG